MSSRSSPALPAFSYAQAAKGIAPANPVSQPATEQNKNGQSRVVDRKPSASEPTALELNGGGKDSVKQDDSKAQSIRAPSQDPSYGRGRTRTSGSVGATSARERTTSIAKNSSTNKKSEVSQAPSKSSSAGSNSSPLKDEESSGTTSGIASSTWEEQSQTFAGAEKSKEDGKSKDTDDDWDKVSVPSVVVERELKAAPIPTVNIWLQRKEAQDAKNKALAAQKTTPNPSTKSNTVQQMSTTAAAKPSGKAGGLGIIDDTEVKDKKKSSDGAKSGAETRKMPRQSRSTQAKDAVDSRPPPPVGDASMWPTPESAVVDDKKPSTTEKSEKADETDSKNAGGKTHAKEKWVKVEVVPTVKWEYYTPPTTSRRGGRSARGGRGGHLASGATNAERTDKPGAMGPPAIPRTQRQEEPTQSESTSPSMRSSSVLAQTGAETQHAEENVQASGNGQDQQSQDAADLSKTETDTSQQLSTSGSSETTQAARPRGDSRASSRFSNGPGYRGNNFDPSRAHHGESHAHPRAQGIERRSVPPDYYSQADIFGKERNDDRGREHGRAKNDFSRENNSNWRDRENHSERPDRREQRPERGRGGYRGRGNHNGFGAHGSQNQSWSTPLPQHPFPAKSQSYNERHRQSSAPFMGNVPPHHSRSNTRSQSIPTAGYLNITGLPQQPTSPTQQDLQGMFYPMSQNMTSQMPYAMDYNLLTTMKMVQAQM